MTFKVLSKQAFSKQAFSKQAFSNQAFSKVLARSIAGLSAGWLLAIAGPSLATIAAIAPPSRPEISNQPSTLHPNPQATAHPNPSHHRVDIPAGVAVPKVRLQVHRDVMKGWNLEIQTENFRFAPEDLDQATSDWQAGHAHLYINGQKVTRLYGSWYYLDHLPSGQVEILVTINTNRHEDLYSNGQRIEARAIVTNP